MGEGSYRRSWWSLGGRNSSGWTKFGGGGRPVSGIWPCRRAGSEVDGAWDGRSLGWTEPEDKA